ncbi:hypothetical protein MPTK1_8g12400 [Marchantia polymorpha subsp. ruderalis]|uniref:Uncharacterized protein n=1 Tax=Marchantia polymorpha TaxID=3197 RepID=A0A2R6WJV0_MARPO|nr:hypothetical protein MARPO_0083s0080 [Marchantia polymorpha]BBN19645.1 hypothetical protein Mp_8g12400 [Marchantia polymorpha subsp. ruderalis]|eukprot:PTQ34122.1 hypothetical protein MARPO_0083s0080 [Marchantia polymorpha]
MAKSPLASPLAYQRISSHFPGSRRAGKRSSLQDYTEHVQEVLLSLPVVKNADELIYSFQGGGVTDTKMSR